MKRIKVVLADFDDGVRDDLLAAMETQEDIEVVGSTAWGDRVVPLLRETEAQVLVTELVLRGMDGLDVIEQVRRELGDEIWILVYSSCNEDGIVNCAVRQGADYYSLKPLSSQVLMRRIRLSQEALPLAAEDERLEYRVSALLHAMGFTPNMKGYRYLRKALCLAVEDPEALYGITKVIYPQVARCYGVAPAAVERSIRSAIDHIWKEGNRAVLNRYFPSLGRKGREKPSNGVFIAVLAEQFRKDREMM